MSEPSELLVATHNAGKVRELARLLSDLPLRLRLLSEFGGIPEAVETGATFAENATLKPSASCPTKSNATSATAPAHSPKPPTSSPDASRPRLDPRVNGSLECRQSSVGF